MAALAHQFEQGRPLQAIGERVKKMFNWLGGAVLEQEVQLDPRVREAVSANEYWQRGYAAGRPAKDYRFDPYQERPSAYKPVDGLSGVSRYETRDEKAQRVAEFRAKHPDANAYEVHAYEYSGVVPDSVYDHVLAGDTAKAYADQNPFIPDAPDPRSYDVPHVASQPVPNNAEAAAPTLVTAGRQ